MKGKNWRECEPPAKSYRGKQEREKRRRKKKRKNMLWKIAVFVVLFAVGYGGFLLYYSSSKPYTIGLDAGHGGVDIGAKGIIQEVELTERTMAELQTLLEEDGRFRIILSREAGEGKTIPERSQLFQKKKLDIVLSIHGNANDDPKANGFECYPAPPGHGHHEVSLAFAKLLAEEMQTVGARLRGSGIEGVRFGYYDENGKKILVDASDTEVYPLDTFGVLKNLDCPAVLVEQCFITNEADVEQFGTEEGCKKAAAAYYRAICRYLERIEETEE